MTMTFSYAAFTAQNYEIGENLWSHLAIFVENIRITKMASDDVKCESLNHILSILCKKFRLYEDLLQPMA